MLGRMGSPSAANRSASRPERPNTVRMPKAPATAGTIIGSPNRRSSRVRPGKRRRDRARATGMAMATLISADSPACSAVKRSTDQR